MIPIGPLQFPFHATDVRLTLRPTISFADPDVAALLAARMELCARRMPVLLRWLAAVRTSRAA